MNSTAIKPAVVAIDMGYGHLRAAYPLANAFGVPVLEADKPPLAGKREERLWRATRLSYENISRFSQLPLMGGPLRRILDDLTEIPHLFPFRDLSQPTVAVTLMEMMIRRGLGEGLAEHLRKTGAPLLTTFYAPAVIADRIGCRKVFCVVTDTDINRVWVQKTPARSRVIYFAPSRRVVKRLTAYGVPKTQIKYTGFPLPESITGGPDLPALKASLARRLVILDPRGSFRDQYGREVDSILGVLPETAADLSPLITFAVGGAGAQAGTAFQLLQSFRDDILWGRIRVALVAGVRPEVADLFHGYICDLKLEARLGAGVRIILEKKHEDYFESFNRLMTETDVLWTKPGELAFYAALGLPIFFTYPVGAHEKYNRRWVVESGAGFKGRDPRFAAERMQDMMADGTLAAAAWSGFMRLPKHGLYRIAEELLNPERP